MIHYLFIIYKVLLIMDNYLLFFIILIMYYALFYYLLFHNCYRKDHIEKYIYYKFIF